MFDDFDTQIQCEEEYERVYPWDEEFEQWVLEQEEAQQINAVNAILRYISEEFI